MTLKTDSDEGCLAALGILLAIPFSVAANGAVLTQLWVWFIVPVFDMAPLRLPEAMGVAAIVAMLTRQNVESPDWGIPLWASAWITSVLKPTLFLSLGWICSLFT